MTECYADFVKAGVRIERERPTDRLMLAALGLAGESGEVIDHLKKHIFHGVPLDRAALLLELGDVRWYYELLLICSGFTDEQVRDANMVKLRARYPERYGGR